MNVNPKQTGKRLIKSLAVAGMLTIVLCGTFTPALSEGIRKKDLKKDVALHTDYGTIVLRLSDETPLHRNNFIEKVKAHELDSMDFYRVINDFLIQTGKDLPAEKGGLIPAEFRSDLFHRRGAVNAAREGDDTNPGQASADLHFTIIQGKVQTDSTLNRAEMRINEWRAYNQVINDPDNAELVTQLQAFYADSTQEGKIPAIQDKLNALTQERQKAMPKYHIPEAHREVYKTKGGSPHLDQNYTVFGEVLKGMAIVDSIATVKTDQSDKPLKAIYIQKAELIKREKYPVE